MKKLVLALIIGVSLLAVSVYVTYVTSTPAQASGCEGGGC